MRLIEYHYQDVDKPGWNFDAIKFKNTNLLVGNTATGKSRLLNTIFNLGRFAVSKDFKHGDWCVKFEHNSTIYKWELRTEKRLDLPELGGITQDNIWKLEDDNWVPIVARNQHFFSYKGNTLPKLSLQETAISLLQEEDDISPIYEGFTTIQRRLFSVDALNKVTNLNTIPVRIIQGLEASKDIKILFQADMNLSANLFLLSKYFKNIFQQIISRYKQVFPFVEEARITDLSKLEPNLGMPGNVPVFTIRERGSEEWVTVNELSSGMQKVLLILTDLFILPKHGVYIIDEYENSLGINAIDFFPEFILDLDKEMQFFVTSHHPYIINEIPVQDWYIFHREGMQVSVKQGEEVAGRFAKSRQQAFIQLINDPFYRLGVE